MNADERNAAVTGSAAELSAFRSAAVLIRFALCMCIGLMLVFGFAGGGIIVIFYSLFLTIICIVSFVMLSLTQSAVTIKRVLGTCSRAGRM